MNAHRATDTPTHFPRPTDKCCVALGPPLPLHDNGNSSPAATRLERSFAWDEMAMSSTAFGPVQIVTFQILCFWSDALLQPEAELWPGRTCAILCRASLASSAVLYVRWLHAFFMSTQADSATDGVGLLIGNLRALLSPIVIGVSLLHRTDFRFQDSWPGTSWASASTNWALDSYST